MLKISVACVVGTSCLSGLPLIDGYEYLDVPFLSQAPDRNWVEPWANACEETSILMVDVFYGGKENLSIDETKGRILGILELKDQKIGFSLDENLDTMVELIDLMDLEWKGVVKEAPTHRDLELELEAGRPFIVPVYAPELNNPYYTGGGPDYHVLVVKGYDKEKEMFVVNDPGTQFGEDLEFSYDVLMRSIHDLDQSDYDAGRKRVLFTELI